MNCRALVVLLVSVSLGVGSTALAGQLSPPADNPSLLPVLDQIQSALKQQQADKAAALADSLLRDHPEDLLSSDAEPELLVSVSARLQGLLNAGDNGLATQYKKQFDEAAHAQLQSLRQSGSNSALAYYAIAQRYPGTAAAAAALARAGDCAAGVGDLPSALVYYRLAKSAGWAPDSGQQKQMADAETALKSAHYQGPVLFDAPWYPDVRFEGYRLFPFASGGFTFFVTPQRLLAFSREGWLQWSCPITPAPAPPVPSPASVDAPPPNGRGAGGRNRGRGMEMPYDWNMPIGVNVLYAAGAPQVVVARDIGGDGNGHLLALAAADGRRLWSTAEVDSLVHLSFFPSPALAGQYVYDLATDSAAQPGTLLLLALNIVSGRELWRSSLGAEELSELQQRMARSTPDYAQPAGITVDEDRLICTPNMGCVIAADRFNGKIRWIRQYEEAPRGGLPAGNPIGRYGNVPWVAGGVVIFAAQDEVMVHALDGDTGALLWEKRNYAGTLVGVAGDLAITAGKELEAMDCRTGNPSWRNAMGGKLGHITGPPVICNGRIYVPTTTGTRVLSVATGTEEVEGLRQVPVVRLLLDFDAVRSALTADGALASFAMPPQPVAPAPKPAPANPRPRGR